MRKVFRPLDSWAGRVSRHRRGPVAGLLLIVLGLLLTGGLYSAFSPASAEFALESVLRHRVAMALPTILTTNLTIEQLAQHYGPHFKSLLTEAAKHYPFSGSDFRAEAGSRALNESTAGLVRPVVVG